MKKLNITLFLLLLTIGLSSCDSHFWSPLSGSRWYAYLEVQGNWERDIYEDDANYMEISFHADGTGNVSFWDDYGYWVTYQFEWDDHGDYVTLYYYDGGYDTFYYDYYSGRLRLSREYSMYSYTEFTH
jgi:hypothetical protein